MEFSIILILPNAPFRPFIFLIGSNVSFLLVGLGKTPAPLHQVFYSSFGHFEKTFYTFYPIVLTKKFKDYED
jgi:hypothetical protein